MPKKPVNPLLRPIGARALKSLIDTLRPHLFESSVLDLYAGQGRVGLSASEEGASHVCFVETNKATLEELKKESGKPHYSRHTTFEYLAMDVKVALSSLSKSPFDIVFADPPFSFWEDKTFWNSFLECVIAVLKTGSIFIVKCPSQMILSAQLPGIRSWKSSVFGESALYYFIYGNEETPS